MFALPTRDRAQSYAGSVRGRGRLWLPEGDFYLTDSIRIPSTAAAPGGLFGEGYATNLIALGNFPAIVFENPDGSKPTRGELGGFRVSRTNTLGSVGSSQSLSSGVEIWGEDIKAADLWIDDCYNAVLFQTVDGDHSRGIHLERIIATHANPGANTSAFQLQVNTVDGYRVIDCEWFDAWLDGIKLRKNCKDGRITRGQSSNNGNALGHGSSGDGLDGFAGCEDLVIEDWLAEGNGGNGLVFKTVGNSVALGVDFNPSWGWMRNIRIARCTLRDNRGSGVQLDGVYNSTTTRGGGVAKLADAGEDDRPRCSKVLIDGCTLEFNDLQGVFCNAFDVTIRANTIRANGRQAIEVMENARDVTISENTLLGNGTESAGDWPQVNVQAGADRIYFDRNVMNGADHGADVEIVNDASYAGLDVISRNGIETEDGVGVVDVRDCDNRYVTSDPYASPVVCFGDDLVVLHHSGTETTPVNRFFGGRGSTYRSISFGGAGTTLYVKESSTSATKTGWVGK